jgi:hypothetical protein
MYYNCECSDLEKTLVISTLKAYENKIRNTFPDELGRFQDFTIGKIMGFRMRDKCEPVEWSFVYDALRFCELITDNLEVNKDIAEVSLYLFIESECNLVRKLFLLKLLLKRCTSTQLNPHIYSPKKKYAVYGYLSRIPYGWSFLIREFDMKKISNVDFILRTIIDFTRICKAAGIYEVNIEYPLLPRWSIDLRGKKVRIPGKLFFGFQNPTTASSSLEKKLMLYDFRKDDYGNLTWIKH